MASYTKLNLKRDVEDMAPRAPGGAEVLAFGAPNTDNKDAEMAPGWWAD